MRTRIQTRLQIGNKWLRAGAALALACSVAVLAGCEKPPPAVQFYSMDVSREGGFARDWSMPDADGKVRTLADFAGKVVYVYFGYAQCPDVCPTTMLELAEVKEALGADADKLQIIFVTVDPERDTPEIMREYVGGFDPGAVALVGTPEQLAVMAREFKVFYKKVPGTAQDNYTVDHSTGSYVYDANGKLRLYVRYGTPVAQLTQDIRHLIDGR